MDNRHVIQTLAIGKPSAPSPAIFTTAPPDPISPTSLQRRWIGKRFTLSTEVTDVIAAHIFGEAQA